MTQPMLEIRDLAKSFGGVEAMRGVSLDFPAGSLTAIIGPNGAGKTTFFNLISGHIRPDRGSVKLDGKELVGLSSLEVVRRGMTRAFQVASIFPDMTMEQSLVAAVTAHRGDLFSMLRRAPLPQSRDRAREIMDLLGLTPRAEALSRNLSHGEQKLLDIGLALALDPKVLLLDEPTAGMGAEERWRMIEKVHALWEASDLTVIFIEHDMDIVFQIAQQIDVLSYGQVLAKGTPDEIKRNQDVIDAYLGQDHHHAVTEGA
ncbi:ABC transporter ATP-binding protein [Albimonas sp. CAU 1670]|uniref:ABC transporter ATP-binding protein n=1 Tax=Albimonas sp. CAU 1670 TaxID=3032599 RepID=UPI0023D9F02F|nr:ABC transporter ATP-binding protein [Albimonas sp. CAU 1670]MDF2233010.1 ABC transporter ATP-binding protein [Albimonas sp. CAU 1670]